MPASVSIQVQTDELQYSSVKARPSMRWQAMFQVAIESLRNSKTRFILTALGMVIGTASVILVVTIGLTGKEFILAEIQKIGTNEIVLQYGGNNSPGSDGDQRGLLTPEDEKAVVSQLPDVKYSSPVLQLHDRVSLGGGSTKETTVLGVSPQYNFVRNLLIQRGRFFDEIDDSQRAKCAVVTETFARERFGNDDAAIGQQIFIRGLPFTIIGVFTQSVNDFGQSEIAVETILVPYSVARYYTGTEEVHMIYFSMNSMSSVPRAAQRIREIVSARHSPNAVYTTQDLGEVLHMAATIANIVTAVLILVAAVTLMVGGVGIMNIMLANIRARIQEIGIRKALGATYNEIRLQFLSEAVIISLFGGIAGCIVGLLLPIAVRLFIGYDFPINLWSVVIALAASLTVGIIFGTVPATRAAQLDPIESLRFE